MVATTDSFFRNPSRAIAATILALLLAACASTPDSPAVSGAEPAAAARPASDAVSTPDPIAAPDPADEPVSQRARAAEAAERARQTVEAEQLRQAELARQQAEAERRAEQERQRLAEQQRLEEERLERERLAALAAERETKLARIAELEARITELQAQVEAGDVLSETMREAVLVSEQLLALLTQEQARYEPDNVDADGNPVDPPASDDIAELEARREGLLQQIGPC